MSRTIPSTTAQGAGGSSDSSSGNKPRNRRFLWICLVILIGLAFAVKPALRQQRLGRIRNLVAARMSEQALDDLNDWGDESAEAYLWRARAARKLGRVEQTRTFLQAAFRNGAAADRLELEQALALAQTGQIAEAEETLLKHLDESPGETAEICEAMVSGYMRNYQFGEASRWIQAWQADFPQDPQPHYAQGTLWQHLRLWNEAVESFEKALQLNETRADIRYRLGNALRQLHRYDRAIQQFETGLQASPDDADMIAGLASCYLSQGKPAAASKLYRRLLEQDPDSVQARLGLGQVAFDEGDCETAIPLLRSALEDEPRNTFVRHLLGSALNAAGETEEAKSHFDFVDKANVAMNEIQQLTRKVQQDPELLDARLEVADLLFEYGSETEAAGWLASVLQLDANHRGAHQKLADYYERTGNTRLAERHRQAAKRGSHPDE